MKLFQILIVMLILNVHGVSVLRRRRRGCSPVNCSVSSWSSWSECSAPCGTDGTQTRTRSVTNPASCGGSCSYQLKETQACNVPGCNDHGSPRSTYCDCVDEWWGTCCENPCTNISNCEKLNCTSADDYICEQCKYYRNEEIRAFRLTDSDGFPNRKCEALCSWRPDSTFCYPGNCPSTPTSCTCAPGFSGDKCMQMTTSPTILYCEANLTHTKTNWTVQADCTDEQEASDTVYTSLVPDQIQVKWSAEYIMQNITNYPKPYYINNFTVGVVASSFDWFVQRDGYTILNGSVTCSTGHDKDNPNEDLHFCNVYEDLNFAFDNHDKVYVTTSATNGGYVDIRNFDDPSGYTVDPKQYYKGQTISHVADFTFDFEKPEHCSISASCSKTMLDAGAAVTKSRKVSVHWSGWTDTLSGISKYVLEIYKMQLYGDLLGYGTVKPSIREELNVSSSKFTTSLTKPGDYCVLLTVHDVAGNIQQARRFLLFDDVNEVEIDTTGQFSIFIESAAANTTFLWQTNLQNVKHSGPQILATWTGHFFNHYHREHKMLNAVADNSPPLTPGYEYTTGQPPKTRSREAIPNINAIVRFEVDLARDHQGGRSIKIPPGNWKDVDEIMVEKQSFNMPREDGDSIRVWVRATDVMGNVNQDNVLVHIDSTPPEVNGFNQTREGVERDQTETTVYGFDAEVMFNAYDNHSGLHTIHWKLSNSTDLTIIHGEGQIPVNKQEISACTLPDCSCIPKDNECYCRVHVFELSASMLSVPITEYGDDYLLTLTVINSAMLETVTSYKMNLQPKEDSNRSYTGIIVGSVCVIVLLLIAFGTLLICYRRGNLHGCFSNIPYKGIDKDNPVDEHEMSPQSQDNRDSSRSGNSPLSSFTTIIDGIETPLSSQLERVGASGNGIYKMKMTDINVRDGLTTVIVKTFKDKHSKDQENKLRHELDIMRQIRLHTNVIHLIGHIKSQRRWPNLGIIMEFAANGTIKEFLQKHSGKAIDDIHCQSNSICNPLYEDANAPTPEKLVDFIGQIANGMQHLSDMNIIHRKLGARNVFLDNRMVCKIGSFSMAIRTTETEKRNNMELQEKLPIRWMALESLNSTCRKFSIKTDVWAFGILMWEILTFGKLPYPEINDDDIAQHVANGNRMKQPPNCDTKLYDMMLRCWLKDSSDRPKFDVLVKDIQNLQSQIKNPESGYGNEKRRRDKRIPEVNRRLLKEPTDTDN